MKNEEKGGQEFANQDKALTDSEGNVFGLQGIDIPERPKDLLSEIKDAQAAAQADKYSGAVVWVCDEGPEKCGTVRGDNGHQDPCYCGECGPSCCGWYVSHKYLLSELEAGTAVMHGGWDADRQLEMFNVAKNTGLVPPVNADWKKWHGGQDG